MALRAATHGKKCTASPNVLHTHTHTHTHTDTHVPRKWKKEQQIFCLLYDDLPEKCERWLTNCSSKDVPYILMRGRIWTTCVLTVKNEKWGRLLWTLQVCGTSSMSCVMSNIVCEMAKIRVALYNKVEKLVVTDEWDRNQSVICNQTKTTK